MTELPYSMPIVINNGMLIGHAVSIFVENDHALLQLKRALDWDAIREVMVKCWRKSGKNIDGGPGCSWPVSLYVPLLVLKIVKGYGNREMEMYLRENVVARLFISMEEELMPQIRDHSNINRAETALGEEGMKEINCLIVREATKFGFADPKILSGDTTAQELRIGYPNEPGILKGVAERCVRALKKLKKKGVEGVESGVEKARRVIKSVKEHHLFAKKKEEKESLLRRIIEETQDLLEDCQKVVGEVGETTDAVKQKALEKLNAMKELSARLIPQIISWMETGIVSKGKILHAGIPKSRSIVRNKAGKKIEFGFQYLINKIGMGYIFGDLILSPTKESAMPIGTLSSYQEIFGKESVPELLVYDRGGHAKKTLEYLKNAGIEKIGIQPKGKAKWLVSEEDQKTVISQRGQTEGSIGTLKSKRYGFNKPLERKEDTIQMAGQRSILSFNLNKFMKDLVQKGKK